MNDRKLNIPIYLNQKIVFDMLASIEDGFSQLSTIQTSSEKNSLSSGEATAEIGSSNVFALLGVKLKGSLKGENTCKDSEILSQEKVHTPSSLFQKLRDYLSKEKLIKKIDNIGSLSGLYAGDFIEIEGELSKNPIVSLMDSFMQMMEIASAFSDSQPSQGKKANNSQQSDKKIINQMKAVSDGLQSGNIVDLICKIKSDESDITAVLPVYNDYFFNRNMNEITDGQYRVIGKITKVTIDSQDSINLLRNTSFSLMQQSMLDTMFAGFKNQDMQDAGMIIPDTSTVVSGPAVMILPIAIFI